MLNINKYRFGNINLMGYYDEKTSETYGYLDTYPASFKIMSGKPVKARDKLPKEIIEFISNQLEDFVKFKEGEYNLKKGNYSDSLEKLELKAALFFNLISDLKSEDKDSKAALKEFKDLNFGEVETMLTNINSTDSKLGAAPKFENVLPTELFFQFFLTKETYYDYFKYNFPDVRIGYYYYGSENPKNCYMPVQCNISDYIGFIKENKNYSLARYSTSFNSENKMFEIRFNLTSSDSYDSLFLDIIAVTRFYNDINVFKKSLNKK